MKLKAPASVQSFIPGNSIIMDSHALVANVGYFYLHKDARNIVSEHQLEKNVNITDVKEGNMSSPFAKHEGVWLAPAADFFSTFASTINAIVERPVTRGYKKTTGTAAAPVATECASSSSNAATRTASKSYAEALKGQPSVSTPTNPGPQQQNQRG